MKTLKLKQIILATMVVGRVSCGQCREYMEYPGKDVHRITLSRDTEIEGKVVEEVYLTEGKSVIQDKTQSSWLSWVYSFLCCEAGYDDTGTEYNPDSFTKKEAINFGL